MRRLQKDSLVPAGDYQRLIEEHAVGAAHVVEDDRNLRIRQRNVIQENGLFVAERETMGVPLTATIAAGIQGDPLNPNTTFGPSATKAQFDTVLEYLASGHADGARATTGGRRAQLTDGLEHGFFIEPTVFADVDPSMRIAREEIFGPVVSVMKYTDIDDAVALANNTEFGLGGIVFGADTDAAPAVADRVDSGSVGINFFASNHSAPFGGRHDSGLGTEYGVEGLNAYLAYKSIHRTTGK